jgi:predicted nucleic acid-binding Zn ribbon protein
MHKTCIVDSCDRPAKLRGWCSAHYQRWRKTGHPQRKCQGCGELLSSSTAFFCGPECKLRRPTQPPCGFDGCEKDSTVTTDLCAGHSRQLREAGELRPFKFQRPSPGGKCVVCDAQIPSEQRRITCSAACRQIHHKSKRNGTRATGLNCVGCGGAVSLTERRADGKLPRSDTRWCRDCYDNQSIRRRVYRYGVSPERFAEAQLMGCEICGRSDSTLHIDHDHNCCSGEYTCGRCVRGFICGSCNRAVGLLNDDADQILAAATYVLKHSNVLAEFYIDAGESPFRS